MGFDGVVTGHYAQTKNIDGQRKLPVHPLIERMHDGKTHLLMMKTLNDDTLQGM